MPAEWETHEATWLGWPQNPTDWPHKLETIRWVYGEIVRRISPGEAIRMLVGGKTDQKLARRYLAAAGCDLKNVQFILQRTNRGWTRDSGPIFVSKDARAAGKGQRRRKSARQPLKRETAIVQFHFNA